MNKLKILLLGLAAISAVGLCAAAAPPAPVVAEKVLAFDTPADLPAYDLALCEIKAFESAAVIEREAVSYAVRQSSTPGRNAVHAKVSAHGRTCRWFLIEAEPTKPLIDYS